MFRIGITIVLCGLVLLNIGCERSEENRKDDENVATSQSESRGESAESEPDDGGPKVSDGDGGYQQLGRVYRQYGEACRAVDADAGQPGQFCQRGMPGMMGQQMMHMHRQHGNWDQGRQARMPMHGKGRGHHGMHGRDKGSQMGPMRHASAMDVWHEQMADWHDQMASQLEEDGRGNLAERHRKIREHHRQMAEAFEGSDVDELEQPASGDDDARRQAGRRLYAAACVACHGPDGEGVSNAFPPLTENSVVGGDSERLISIVVFGLRGPVEVDGRVYDGIMPSFADRLSDAQIASVLTFIRHRWNSGASAISPSEVASVREDAPDERPLSSDDIGVAP